MCQALSHVVIVPSHCQCDPLVIPQVATGEWSGSHWGCHHPVTIHHPSSAVKNTNTVKIHMTTDTGHVKGSNCKVITTLKPRLGHYICESNADETFWNRKTELERLVPCHIFCFFSIPSTEALLSNRNSQAQKLSCKIWVIMLLVGDKGTTKHESCVICKLGGGQHNK